MPLKFPAPAFDVGFSRSQFPDACWSDTGSANGSSVWAMFENAGGSFVPNAVIKRMTAYMTENQVQPGANYPKAQLAADRMKNGHARMAEMIGVEHDEIVIGPSTSINVYILAQALRHLWHSGDEIIVSVGNHEANSSPWYRLTEYGLNIIDWRVNQNTGSLDLESLLNLLTEKTRLVAFPHVSNIAGDINDVTTITKIVHDAGAMVCVDGVAYAPHRAIDVKAWDVDFYLFSFYKIMGPHMGCLYGRRDRLLEAKGQGHYFFPETDIAHKLNPAGPNHESIAALAGIADYFEALAAHHLPNLPNTLHARTQGVFALIAAHEQALSERFLDFVHAKPSIRLLGSDRAEAGIRAPTFSFTVDGKTSAEVTKALQADYIALDHGNFYAPRLLEAVGITDTDDGVIRASMVHYNTLDEVDRLTAVLDRII